MPSALEGLGYSSSQIEEIISYAVGHQTLGNAPGVNHTALIGHGFGKATRAGKDRGRAALGL